MEGFESVHMSTDGPLLKGKGAMQGPGALNTKCGGPSINPGLTLQVHFFGMI